LPAELAGTDAAGRQPGDVRPPPGSRAPVPAGQHHAPQSLLKSGVPVEIDIPIRTPGHPYGVHAKVTSHPLNPDGSLFVPADPQVMSWANQDAKPGSGHGTAILTSHINYVINGRLVLGALSDLAYYAQHSVGKTFHLRLADGRTQTYRIIAGREYSKDQLAGNRKLRAALFDQRKVYGPPGKPSGRLLLVSCGGAFDAYTGEYEDNVFLYALPVF
jgi:hypothetical protein